MKKYLLLCYMTLCLFILAGCGGNLISTVNLNDDESGSRVMTLTISKEDFSEYVNGTIEAVDQTIASNCPSVMTYFLSEDETSYTATFTMNFSSILDYKTQVSTIMTAEPAEIEYRFCDSVFSEGIVYEEDFSGPDIMSWLSTLMQNSGYVSSENASYIFEEESYALNYGGQEFASDSGYRVSVSNVTYTHIESIDILTEVLPDNHYNRTINIHISDSDIADKKDAITTYLDEGLASGVTGAWSADMGMNTYAVEMKNLSLSEMRDAMAKFCHSENSEFTNFPEWEDDAFQESAVLFSEDASFIERLDMSNFGCNSAGEVNVNYCIKDMDQDETLYYIDESYDSSEDEVDVEETKSVTDWFADQENECIRSDYYYDSDTYEGYHEYYLYDMTVEDIGIRSTVFNHFSGVDYNVKIKNPEKIEKKLVFTFDDDATADLVKNIADTLNEKVSMAEESAVQKLTITPEDKTLTIVMRGTTADIEEQNQFLTSIENANNFHYAEESKFLSFTKKCVYSESVNLRGYVFSSSDERWSIPVNYTLELGGKVVIDNPDLVKEGNLYTATLQNNESTTESLVVSKLNGSGFAMVLVLLIAILMLFVGVIMLLIAIIKGVKKKKAAQPIPQSASQPIPQSAAQPIPQPVEQPIPQPVEQPIPQPVEQPIPQPVEPQQ